MKTLLILLLILNISSAFAAEPWAYCDGRKRAYLLEERYVVNCPTPPRRPGEPARLPEVDPDLDQCTSEQIFAHINHPELNYICAYPTAAESGDDATRNTNRCINADKKHCTLDAGGVAGPGAHAIPGSAWYHQTGSTLVYPDIRCQCGCFIGETMIAGLIGYTRIDALAEQAKAMPIEVLQFSQSKGQTLSMPLRGPDFTVGPEEKPVIRIATKSGGELAVTDIHPIFVLRGDSMTMVQAKNLQAGDALMDENGNMDAVLLLESYKLDLNANKVYNLDTRSVDPEEHVISANKILVGDLYWQKRQSEESDRVDNLLASAQQL